MLSWSWAYYISEWAIRLVMLAVVPRRRAPSAATAWLLVIFFAPWVGLALYVLFGEYRLPRRRARQHAQILERLESVGYWVKSNPHVVRPLVDPRAMATVALAENLAQMPIVGGNAVEFITETDEVIARLVADIDRAEHHVHLLFYIYSSDETGRQVTDALARAAARGVQCRVLVDGVGSRLMLRRHGEATRALGIQLREALPVGLLRRGAARVDLRNHRKLAVVDGRIAYAGSQNIINADYGHKDMAWHDIMARLAGPVVLELQAVFAEDWYFETRELLDSDPFFPAPLHAGETPVQALPSGPDYPVQNYQRLIVAAAHAARERITITTPYMVPDEALLQAFQVAVLRGVEVEIIVPSKTDHPLVDAASRAYYDHMLDSGVKLYLYQQGLLHSKTMTVDDAIALIGSSNFDIRSFALNFELNLVLYGSAVSDLLRVEQERYIEGSVELDRDEWQRRPVASKAMHNVAKLLSPLL